MDENHHDTVNQKPRASVTPVDSRSSADARRSESHSPSPEMAVAEADVRSAEEVTSFVELRCGETRGVDC